MSRAASSSRPCYAVHFEDGRKVYCIGCRACSRVLKRAHECGMPVLRVTGLQSFFVAEWMHYVASYREGFYRVYDPDYPDQTVACIDGPDDLPDFPLLFVDGPLAEHSYPLDITVLTDTDDLPF